MNSYTQRLSASACNNWFADLDSAYLRQHQHFGNFLVFQDIVRGELDLFEVDFPFLHVSRQEQFLFFVLKIHPEAEVLLSGGVAEFDDVVEALEFFEGVLEGLLHVLVHRVDLFLERLLCRQQRLPQLTIVWFSAA